MSRESPPALDAPREPLPAAANGQQPSRPESVSEWRRKARAESPSRTGQSGAAGGALSQVSESAAARMTEEEFRSAMAPLLVPSPPPPPPLTRNAETDDHGGVTDVETEYLRRFLELQKQSALFHSRMQWTCDQVTRQAYSHDKDAAACRHASDTTVHSQRRRLEEIEARLRLAKTGHIEATDRLKASVERVAVLEQENYALALRAAELEQRRNTGEARTHAAEAARSVAEVRQTEAEAAAKQISGFADMLHSKLFAAGADRDAALLRQYDVFAEHRNRLIQFFTARETELITALAASARTVYQDAEAAGEEHTKTAVAHWKVLYDALKKEYHELEETVQRKRAALEQQALQRLVEADRDRARQESLLRAEQERASDVLRRREDALTQAIATRERELDAREARLRDERAAWEQDAALAVHRKEMEIRAKHETALIAAREAFDRERERMVDSFTDQLHKISNMHLNNERELERLHREKEREMMQRHRHVTAAIEDTADTSQLHGVSSKTQEALLSRFDSVEMKQRERAEQLRAALKVDPRALPPGSAD